MRIVPDMAEADKFNTFASARDAAEPAEESFMVYDTRIDTTADGYVIRVLDMEGDDLGYIAGVSV